MTVSVHQVVRVILVFIAALCLLLAALTAAGLNIAGASMWAWAFGGATAFVLAFLAP